MKKEMIQMTKEIKEILEYLKDKDDYIEDFGISYKRIHIDNGDLKILLDYITNLQEELKSANDSISWHNNRFKAVARDKAKLRKIIDKAIDCIYNHPIICCHYLLNILQGSEDND